MWDSLVHAVTAVPLDARDRDPLSDTGHQVFLSREVVVRQVFNLRGNYTQREPLPLIIADMDTNIVFQVKLQLKKLNYTRTHCMM